MDFEKEILGKMDAMNLNLATLNDRLSTFEGETKAGFIELSGRIKGNNELIIKDLSSYTEKDVCEHHRENQGTRIGSISDRLIEVESQLKQHLLEHATTKGTTTNALINWIPGVLKTVIVAGAGLLAFANGWIGG